jgi:hypothetical protein
MWWTNEVINIASNVYCLPWPATILRASHVDFYFSEQPEGTDVLLSPF